MPPSPNTLRISNAKQTVCPLCKGKTVMMCCAVKTTVVSKYPTKSIRAGIWNRSESAAAMIKLLVMISILQLSLATEQTSHHRHQRRDFPSHPHRRQGRETERLGKDINVEARETERFIYECPDNDYPKELENWMDGLSLMDTKVLDSSTEKPDNPSMSLKDYKDKIGEDVRNGKISGFVEDRNESMEMTSFTDPTTAPDTWGPNRRLLEIDGRREKLRLRLVKKKYSCPVGGISKTFHWHPIMGINIKPATFSKLELSNMSLIVEDESLVWNKQEGERHVYTKNQFCIWRRGKGKSEWVSFKVCASENVISKCCEPGKVVSWKTRGCIPAKQRWTPIFYRGSNGAGKNSEQQVIPDLSYIVGFPNCSNKYFLNESPETKLLMNGSLVQFDGPKRTYIKAGEFCIDGIYLSEKHNYEKKGRGDYEGVVFALSEWDQFVIACEAKPIGVNSWRLPLFSTLNFISAVFLLVTLVVYLLLWRHQNIHGWLQFAYATSLLCTFITFIIVQQWSAELIKASKFLCKMMGWITHLTYLSAFFWLTSMNFDLWWRFSRPLRTTRMTPQEKKKGRFLGFTVFSIGIPLMISSIGISLDHIYKDTLIKPPYIIPGFGIDKCYFANKPAQVPYLYAPAGILLLIDLIFFTSTVFHLRKMHAHTELARTQSTSSMEDKKGLRVIAKLFVVMGVLWVFELVSWIANLVFPDKGMILIWIFIPIDVLNSLQGVAIFFIFVCKPNVGNQLRAKFRKGINKTNFLQLQQSNSQSNQTNSSNIMGSNETLFTVQSDAEKE